MWPLVLFIKHFNVIKDYQRINGISYSSQLEVLLSGREFALQAGGFSFKSQDCRNRSRLSSHWLLYNWTYVERENM